MLEKILAVDRGFRHAAEEVVKKSHQGFGIDNYNLSNLCFGATFAIGLYSTADGILTPDTMPTSGTVIWTFNSMVQIYRNHKLQKKEEEKIQSQGTIDLQLHEEKQIMGKIFPVPAKPLYAFLLAFNFLFLNGISVAFFGTDLAGQYLREVDLPKPERERKLSYNP